MNGEIIHGDSTEELAEIDETPDMVFADFPFYLDDHEVEQIAQHSYDLLPDEGNMAVINNPSNHFKFHSHFSDFEFRNGVVLPRNHAFYPAWHLGFQHNYLWLLYKEDRSSWYGNRENHNQDSLTDVWEAYDPSYAADGEMHPEAIPEWLTERIISLCTEPGDLVVDPFFGSGTTGVVCERTDREYIGIELEKEYVELAESRIKQDWSQHNEGLDW